MSVEATTWALHQQLVTDPGARSVLFGLANHANHEGRHAFPSVNLLCRYTGLSRRSVIAKLKLLVDTGLIQKGNQRVAAAIIDRSDRRPVVYDLRIDLGIEPVEIGDEDTPDPDNSRGAESSPRENEPGANAAPRNGNGVQSTTLRGAGSAPEPSLTNPNSLSGASGSEHSIFQNANRLDDQGQPLTGGARQFPMSLDWVPNAELFTAQCFRAGLPADTTWASHQLAKFTAHHADQPNRRHGESAWIAKFVDWVRSDLNSNAKPTATNKNAPQGARHANSTQRPRQYQSAAEARRAAEQGRHGQPSGATYDGEWSAGNGAGRG